MLRLKIDLFVFGFTWDNKELSLLLREVFFLIEIVVSFPP
jgi:hypothetical protein